MYQLIFLSIFVLGNFWSHPNPVNDEERYKKSGIVDILEQAPEFIGPSQLCNFFGSVLGTFSVGGDPEQDRYTWEVLDSFGTVIFSRFGGATFESVTVNFTSNGQYEIRVSVTRGNAEIYATTRALEVLQGPQLIVRPDYLLCGEEPAALTALPPTTPNLNAYTIEWRNEAGVLVGNQNVLVTDQEGTYTVSAFLNNPNGSTDCVINGFTYIGPPEDFELIIQDTTLCLNQRLQIAPDNPMEGAWFYRKEGFAEKISLGRAFDIDAEASQILDGPGNYEIIFEVSNTRNPDCLSTRSVSIQIQDSPTYQFTVVTPATTCNAFDGVLEFSVLGSVDELRILEIGLIYDNIVEGEVVTVTGLQSGIYTIQAESIGCLRTSVVIVPIDEVAIEDFLEISALPEVCTSDGIEVGSISIRLLNGPLTNWTYRLVNAIGRDEVVNAPIPNLLEFSIDLPGGLYAIEFIDEAGCIFPWESVIQVQRRNRVNFSVPATISICDTFSFTPTSNQELIFTLTYPDGTTLTQVSGQAFDISQPGIYRIVGRENSENPENCPRIREFEVNVETPIEFEPIIVNEDCFGNIFYQANLFGRSPNEVSIRWLDGEGNIVGRQVNWIPTAYEEFRLEVRPRRSSSCEIQSRVFQVPQPVFEVELDFAVNPFCPELPTTELGLLTDFDKVDRIEWLRINPDGSQEVIPAFEDIRSVLIEEDGLYEAVVYRRLFNGQLCEIGRNQLLMIRSVDQTRPELAPFYSICRKINLSEIINPGIFESYQWFLEDNPVSTSPIFRPQLTGSYTLVVTNLDGCQYVEEFSVFEDCEFQYRMPTAMIIDDPERHFEVFVNDAVEEARIWIHNRQGELIYYCEDFNVQSRVAFCFWDGSFQGQKIPSGQYVVTLSYKSERFGVNEKISQSLTVLNN
ncbi:hypothetical protein [Mongoliitalea daihaiensis]|uniref:hypothetical protein n=1 Tax=Mongoliitalea daihaiensis TaxID=2782006 RepID=UPI001F39E70E|nr:hypothetical protein [Mongoliitalea daihaiensis]UJP65447.1 hypothetical protein IPZ59_02135 [Mongoliitalea daihaiensis]